MSDTDTSHPDVPQAQPTPDDYAANLPGLLNYFGGDKSSSVGASHVISTVKAAVRRALYAEAKLAKLEAENSNLKAWGARLNQACDIFEKNSEDATQLWEKNGKLQTENASLRELLKRLEWISHPEGVGRYCEVCDRWQEDGHADECRLAKALGTSG